MFLLSLCAAVALATLSPSSARSLTNCSVGETSLDGEELAFLRIINDYRTSNGAGPLSVSSNLSRAAVWKANDMGTRGYFGHTDSAGRGPWELTVDCGYPIAGGENLAAGTFKDTASSAFELFRNSPTHNANMLRGDYRQIGIGRVFVAGSTYGWYWATEFGTTNDAAPPPPPPPPSPPPPRAAPPAAPERQAPAATNPLPETPETPEAAMPAAPEGPADPMLRLAPRALRWERSTTSIENVVAAPDGRVEVVYTFEPETGVWRRYAVGLPAFVSDLEVLRAGEDYWVVTLLPAVLP